MLLPFFLYSSVIKCSYLIGQTLSINRHIETSILQSVVNATPEPTGGSSLEFVIQGREISISRSKIASLKSILCDSAWYTSLAASSRVGTTLSQPPRHPLSLLQLGSHVLLFGVKITVRSVYRTREPPAGNQSLPVLLIKTLPII